MSFASLEFDRVLKLVATFARSERGQQAVIATLPRFTPGEGSLAFRLSSEVRTLLAANGAFSFDGLDAAGLLEGTVAGPADGPGLARLVTLVRRIVEVRTILSAATGPELLRLTADLPRLDALLAFCELRLAPTGEVLDSASPALAQARAARDRHRAAIVAALEQLRRQQRTISGPFTLRRERYCVPVPAGERQSVPGLLLDVSSSGATAFVEPFPVVELNNALAEATATARGEEERVLGELAAAFGRHRDELLRAADALADLDARQARVLFGLSCTATLLEPGVAGTLRLVRARHPLLDPVLAPLRREALGEAGSTRPVVPLDLEFPEGARLVLLSGPNAGGKTVALKTVGLVALMAQSGIPVLADEGSALPSFTRLWCHLGDEQNLFSDLSTFTGAMRATASLLAEADEDTLVLYDELGSGTDPEEGAALAAALLEEFARRRCWALATAHLVTVAAHLESVPGAINAAMGYDEGSSRPTFTLHLGSPGRSRGLAIASACGIPVGVLARAREMVSRAFLAIDGYLVALQGERDRLQRAREVLEGAEQAARAAEARAEEERRHLTAEQEKTRHRLAEEREALRRRARERLAEAVAELEQARARGEFPGKRRLAAVRSAALHLDDEERVPTSPPEALAVGATVRLRGTPASGQISRLAGDRVELLVGDKRLWVEASDCEPTTLPLERPTHEVEVAAGEPPPAELKLIGLTQDEAREELERFLDRASLSGAGRVRVVHGHGTGTLRRMVREVLAHHPAVAHFSHPPQFRGGTGVTEAELKG